MGAKEIADHLDIGFLVEAHGATGHKVDADFVHLAGLTFAKLDGRNLIQVYLGSSDAEEFRHECKASLVTPVSGRPESVVMQVLPDRFGNLG